MNRIAKLKRPSAARDDCGNHAARYAGAFDLCVGKGGLVGE